MFKMIVFDLDGTILNKKRQITKNTIDYLKKVKEEGIIITIATGRIYASAIAVTEGAEFANYLITDAGTCTYDLMNGLQIESHSLDRETIEKIFSYYNDSFRFIEVCDKNFFYKYTQEVTKNPYVKTGMDKEYILDSCKEISHAAIALKKGIDITSLYNKLKKELKDVNIIMMQDSFEEGKWLEILPLGCSKYNAIKKIAEKLDIKNEEILAFGDGGNDAEMIEKCGFGVAMKNALSNIKKVAKDITKEDFNHDGVIKYLKDYFEKTKGE